MPGAAPWSPFIDCSGGRSLPCRGPLVRGVGSDDQSGADVDMDHLSGFHGGGGFEQCRKDRSIGAYFIASHVDDDNPKPESLEIMLPLQLSVDGHENVERFLSV